MNHRVLVVLPEPPLAFGGAAARWYHVLLNALARSKCEATVLAACPPHAVHDAREALKGSAITVRIFPHADTGRGLFARLRSFARPFSYVFGRDMRHEFEREASSGRYDLIHFEHPWGLRMQRKEHTKTLATVHFLYALDLECEPGSTPLDRLRRWSAIRAERKLLSTAQYIVPLTGRLAAKVKKWNRGGYVRVMPIALDLSLYPYSPRPANISPPVVTLIGSFGWSPTRQAAQKLVRDLWPRIISRVPNAKLRLVGRGAESLRSWLPHDHSTMEVMADVPDIRPHFHSADVLLYAPGRGSGMKVKVMEAMALGTAVVTNGEGAEGLEGAERGAIRVHEEDTALVESVVELLKVDRLRLLQVALARRFMEELCAEGAVARRLDEMYESIASVRE